MFIIEMLIVLVVGAVASVGLLTYYFPKVDKIKKDYEDFNNTMRENLRNMSEEERSAFFSNMSNETESFFNNILNNNTHFTGIEQFQAIQHHLAQVEQIQHDQFEWSQDFSQWAMNETVNESMRAITPFDHGGYVQGDGFNPSDTLAQQMNNDMYSMDMNNGMDMNNHHDYGGF